LSLTTASTHNLAEPVRVSTTSARVFPASTRWTPRRRREQIDASLELAPPSPLLPERDGATPPPRFGHNDPARWSLFSSSAPRPSCFKPSFLHPPPGSSFLFFTSDCSQSQLPFPPSSTLCICPRIIIPSSPRFLDERISNNAAFPGPTTNRETHESMPLPSIRFVGLHKKTVPSSIYLVARQRLAPPTATAVPNSLPIPPVADPLHHVPRRVILLANPRWFAVRTIRLGHEVLPTARATSPPQHYHHRVKQQTPPRWPNRPRTLEINERPDSGRGQTRDTDPCRPLKQRYPEGPDWSALRILLFTLVPSSRSQPP